MFPQQPATHPEPQPQPYEVPSPERYVVVPPEQHVVPPEQHHVPQPELFQVPRPVPAATDIGGPEWSAWGPSATGPADLPPPAPPVAPSPAVPGRSTFRILVAVAVVLAAAIAVTAVLGWSDVSQRREGVSDRRAEQAAIAQQEQAAARKLLDDFRAAGLDAKLQRVKDLDKAADVAFRSWENGTVRLGVLDKAMDECNDAVIAYNDAAGPFPDELLTTMPRRINLENPETDCGRAFTKDI